LIDAQSAGVLEAHAYCCERSDDASELGSFSVPAHDIAGGVDSAYVPTGAHGAEGPDNMCRAIVSLVLFEMGAGQVAVHLDSAHGTATDRD
jgi:hypothetical protein